MMKKLYIIISTLIFIHFCNDVKGQVEITSILNTNQIVCNGGLADVSLTIDNDSGGTIAPIQYQLKVFKSNPFVTFSFFSTNNTFLNNVSASGLDSALYYFVVVDSVAFNSTYNPLSQFFGTTSFINNVLTHPSVYDFDTLLISAPDILSFNNTEIIANDCYGDNIAQELLLISGGTQPYYINGNLLSANDTTFSNLSAGTYSYIIDDTNACSDTAIFTIDPLTAQGPNGYVTGDISCFGASDGEITAIDSLGGTILYAIDDTISWTSNSIFSGLAAGTYTIYYKNANNCVSSEFITLNDPSDLSGTININDIVSCFGVNDAQIQFNVDPNFSGTPGPPANPYSYSLNAGVYSNSSIFNNLFGNQTFVITIKDGNDCTYSDSVFVVEPDELTFDVSVTSENIYNGFGVSCNGSSDGEITFSNILGGTPNFLFSIDGGTTFLSDSIFNNTNSTNISAGIYIVQVQDDVGCLSTMSDTVTEPMIFTATAVENQGASCFSLCDASLTVICSTETIFFSSLDYDLSGIAQPQNPTFNNLCGSTDYFLTVTNSNNCVAYDTISLSEPLDWLYTLDSAPEYCGSGQGSATITIDDSTGTLPFNYFWSDSQNTPTANSLTSGLYTVVVTDANGCIFSDSISVTAADLTLNYNIIPACNNANDASAEVIPNGTPPYTYSWNNGQTTAIATNLASNTIYSVTVIDSFCTKTISITTPNSAIVDVQLDSSNSQLSVPCYGDPSNGIEVVASGGTGPNTYQYYIPYYDPVPQNTGTYTGLFVGNYSIYTTDANGCTDSVSFVISQPNELNLYNVLDSATSCFGGSDGSAAVDGTGGGSNPLGGTSPYSYSWSNLANGPYVTNLSAGNYTLTITDNNGCFSSDVVTILEPTILQSQANVLNTSKCSGNQTTATGEIEVVASGATPSYSYLWSTGDTTSSIDLLVPGTYTVLVTDANGCSLGLDTAEIFAGENPDLLTTIENVSCYAADDGIITPSAIGGASPYQFSNDGSNYFTSGNVFSNLDGGFYFVTVVDSLGCLDTDSIFVEEPALLEVTNINIENISCNGANDGQLTPVVTGGRLPYTYLWDDSNNQDTSSAIGLSPGNYTLTVTDSSGCIAISNASITEPDSLMITSISSDSALCFGESDGNVYVTVLGGTPTYNFNWSFGGTTANSNAPAGLHNINVTDFNGCSVDSVVFVDQPNQIITSFIKDSISCQGLTDGSAEISVFGGTGDFSYLWANGSDSSSAADLSPGYQLVSITDENMCVILDSVEIFEPNYTLSIDSIISSDITCYSANNGTIAVYASGGLTLEYFKSDGFTTSSQINNLFTSVASGFYIITVEDFKGCFDTVTFSMSQPDSLYIDTTIFSHVQCFSLSNGSIDNILAVGGTGSYQFSVNGGPLYLNTAYFNGYNSGTYTVEVLDENNCIAQDIIIIDEPPVLNVAITPSLFNNYQIRCHSDSSGIADFSISGGVAPYLKTTVSNGDTVITYTTFDTVITYTTFDTLITYVPIPDTLSSYNSNFSGLTAGTYEFIVEDAYGCVYLESIVYNEPDPITHSFVIDHVTCHGWNNGSLTDIVSGGIGNPTTYHYLWNTGDTTYTIDNLVVDTFSITVTDENGCSTTAEEIINDDNKLSANIDLLNTQHVSCFDYCDGEIVLDVVGGIPNITPNGNPVYSYQWNDTLLQTTATAVGLCVNNNVNSTLYTCIISDAQGCFDTVTYLLIQPEKLNTTIDIIDPIKCFGESLGKVKAEAQGGNTSTPYIYLWSNGETTDIVDSLSMGNFVVVVTDNLGCSDTSEVLLEEPTSLSVSISSESDVTCFAYDDGEITATPSGGTPVPGIPPTYYYLWDDSDGQTTRKASGLSPDVYTVTVTDANGCEVTSQTVNISGPTSELVVTADSTDETCLLSDGSAQVFVLGGIPDYDFIWTGPVGFSNTNSNISNLKPGLYSVTVTDANGCEVSTNTTVNGVTEILLPGNVSLLDTTICLGTTITLNVQEKPGLFYSWDDGSTNADKEISPTDPINNYVLTVVDPNCLSPYTVEVIVRVTYIENTILNDANSTVGDNPIITSDDQINLQSDNLFDAYSWSNGGSSSSILVEPLESTWYTLMVDSSGCLGIDSIYVVLGVIPYDAITPNGDQMNDVWEILDIENYPSAIVKVFNRWGEIVFESNGGAAYIPWDGMFESEELPVGTYYYVIDLNNGEDPQTGPITIVR
jgi:gliding motility-associated-like protein